MMNTLPLLSSVSEKSNIAFYNDRIIRRDEFLTHVERVRKQLSNKKYCINLCENRYHFLVVFSACITLNQISLLPSSRADKEIERLSKLYPDNYSVTDSFIEILCNRPLNKLVNSTLNYKIESNQVVSIVFTSGSTGTPKANAKTWMNLFDSAERVKQRFNLNLKQQHSIIATIPPQHMFGFETTIVYPLILGVIIHAGRPFYPLDIQKSLMDMPAPRILITTPLHLKSCNSYKKNWPKIDFVISATDKMPESVAMDAEKILNTRVFEIYGCSEAGAIATRQMTKSRDWHLLKKYSFLISNNETTLITPSYTREIVVPDQVEMVGEEHFKLIGRDSDLVNIGGKRASLADLTNILKSIDSVSDGIFILPDEKEGKRLRLAAIVVAQSRNEKKYRAELAKFVDSVFLPRPLIFVDKLPYNELGKLPRAKLLTLLHNQSNKLNSKGLE